MKVRFLTPIILAAATLMPAQDRDVTILPYPYYEDVKRYLGLSDAQTQSLEAILRNRNQAQQGIWSQTSEKIRQLQQLLESGTGSPAQIGQLVIDIRNLEKQLPTIEAPYRAQALNVLTADQKPNLAKLDEAWKLQATASQAAMLMLLEYPQPIGLPRPVDFGVGIGSTTSISAVAPVNRRQ